MDQHFAAVQKTIAATPSLADVRLLTVTLDPAFDRPAILKAYARRREADPAIWTFLTGEPAAVNAFASQFGLYVEHNPQNAADITHNLRTAVIDPEGRLVKVHSGNSWTPAELVADLSAAPPPAN
jgi:protein SCO1/2